MDLFKKLSLNFACVLDSSDTAMNTAYQKYGAMAVPTSYLIDKEGKVAAAWVGYDEESDQVTPLLKKLGIE